MKLATLKNGRPDGQLIVVSRDMTRFVAAGRVAPTLQAALDDWERAAPELEKVSEALNAGDISSQPFEPGLVMAPLPRAYQWIDGAGFLSHLERVRTAKGSKDAGLETHKPLLYQGGSDSLSAATDPIVVPDEDLATDFEAEVAVITGPVPMGADKPTAEAAIRLVTICNDVSLRRLVASDLQDGFGFFHSKPSTSFGPVVVTPDELGMLWRQNRLHARVEVFVNDVLFGQPNAGEGMFFDFADLIVAASQTRQLGCGTIIGSGTVANEHDDLPPIKRDGIGFACIVEARTMEKLANGRAETPFLQPGDNVRIAARDGEGNALFGAIDQVVQKAGS